MNREYRIDSGEQQFILKFSFSENTPLTAFSKAMKPDSSSVSAVQKVHHLEVLVYREDLPEQQYHSKHLAGSRSEIPFQLSFDDLNNIKGTLSLFHDCNSGLHFVWGDIHCGPEYEKHFMGALTPVL